MPISRNLNIKKIKKLKHRAQLRIHRREKFIIAPPLPTIPAMQALEPFLVGILRADHAIQWML
jgi:hypothetical protein